MSQENVEMVRPVYDALRRRDWDMVFRDMHPDFEMTTQRGFNAGTHRRREAVQSVVEDAIAAFDNLVVEPEEFLEPCDIHRRLPADLQRAHVGLQPLERLAVKDERVHFHQHLPPHEQL